MTIDECIYYETSIERTGCERSFTKYEHQQIAEWLKELKWIKETSLYTQAQLNFHKELEYNKAIDDFLQELINYGVLGLKDSTQWRKIHDIASQVRERGKNETNI